MMGDEARHKFNQILTAVIQTLKMLAALLDKIKKGEDIN